MKPKEIKTGDYACIIGIGSMELMAIDGAKHPVAARIFAVGSRPIFIELA